MAIPRQWCVCGYERFSGLTGGKHASGCVNYEWLDYDPKQPPRDQPQAAANSDNGAKKYDAAKVPVVAGAINYFPRALLALATNSDYGFRKYGAWGGWRNVPDGQRRYTDADGRHLLMEQIEGPYDRESGIAHAVMHAWNAMARVEKLLEEGAIELRRGNDIVDGKPVPGTHRAIEL